MKYLARGLVIAVLMAVLTAVASVSLALPAEDVVYFSVGDCIPENDYIFLLLKPGTSVGSIRNSSILHIDQLTAKGSTMEVAVVYPDFEACDVVVGGVFGNEAGSPRHLGTFSAARLPDRLNEIGEEAFCGSSITHVYLSEQVTAIGKRAFADCLELSYIYIPDSAQEIAPDAFEGCGQLVIGCTEGSEAQRFAAAYGIECKVLK